MTLVNLVTDPYSNGHCMYEYINVLIQTLSCVCKDNCPASLQVFCMMTLPPKYNNQTL